MFIPVALAMFLINSLFLIELEGFKEIHSGYRLPFGFQIEVLQILHSKVWQLRTELL